MPNRRVAQVFTGENSVLAFVRPGALRSVDPRIWTELRAQLRGLGSALLLLSEDAGRCLRPDDELEVQTAERALGARSFDHACQLWGVEPARLRAGAIALFVVDDKGALRFSRESACDDEPLELLVRALSEACRNGQPKPSRFEITRRELVISSLVSAFAGALLYACSREPSAKPSLQSPPPSAAAPPAPPPAREATIPVTLRVNGQSHTLDLPAVASLLDTLRERLGLTGTKKGCDHGQCGACTVLIDGRRVNACLTLAVMVDGREITSIEGLSQGDALHPMQAAFVHHDAFQCGFCTPGQIVSAVGMVAEGHAHEDAEIREAMSGNLCRCGAYNNIVHAIRTVQKGA